MSLRKLATTLRQKARLGRITAGAASTSTSFSRRSTGAVNMVQSVAIVALNVGYSFTGGSFSLGLDLSVYGLGFVNTPIPIQFNAISERFEENRGSTVVGRQSGQPVQSILESIPALRKIGIRVSVRVFGDVFSSNPPSHDESCLVQFLKILSCPATSLTQVHIVGWKKVIAVLPSPKFCWRNFDNSRSIFDGTAWQIISLCLDLTI